MRSCFTNICDPVSQICLMLQIYAILFQKIYAIRCHKYLRCYKYMRSCFTNICDLVSQIYAMLQIYAILFHKQMRSGVTNIRDITNIYGIVFHKYMRPVSAYPRSPRAEYARGWAGRQRSAMLVFKRMFSDINKSTPTSK